MITRSGRQDHRDMMMIRFDGSISVSEVTLELKPQVSAVKREWSSGKCSNEH